MAQLPPKIPSHHQKLPFTPSLFPFPSTAAAAAAATTNSSSSTNPSWAHEFLDFSAARRGAHRRSASGPVTFVADEDELIMTTLISDDVPPSSPASDRNSFNNEKVARALKDAISEAEEGESECKVEAQTQEEPAAGGAEEKPETLDQKRVKRILANRQSAQRSRVRKLQYISELERNVTTLQTEVSALSPRVAYLDHQRSVLTVGNSHLKQRIAALAQDGIFKEAHQEALKKEIERLRHVYHQQNQISSANEKQLLS